MAMPSQEKSAAASGQNSEASAQPQQPQQAPQQQKAPPPPEARDTAENLLKLPEFEKLPGPIDRMDAFLRSEHLYVERALRVVVEGFEERLRHHIDVGDQVSRDWLLRCCCWWWQFVS